MENYDQNAKELRGSFNNISDTQGNCTLKEDYFNICKNRSSLWVNMHFNK